MLSCLLVIMMLPVMVPEVAVISSVATIDVITA